MEASGQFLREGFGNLPSAQSFIQSCSGTRNTAAKRLHNTRFDVPRPLGGVRSRRQGVDTAGVKKREPVRKQREDLRVLEALCLHRLENRVIQQNPENRRPKGILECKMPASARLAATALEPLRQPPMGLLLECNPKICADIGSHVLNRCSV